MTPNPLTHKPSRQSCANPGRLPLIRKPLATLVIRVQLERFIAHFPSFFWPSSVLFVLVAPAKKTAAWRHACTSNGQERAALLVCETPFLAQSTSDFVILARLRCHS